METRIPVEELAKTVAELTVKLETPEEFFDRDYLDVTADIDELEYTILELIKIIRFYARSFADADDEEEITEDVPNTESNS